MPWQGPRQMVKPSRSRRGRSSTSTCTAAAWREAKARSASSRPRRRFPACFALGGGPLSTAGTEIEVATGGRANVNVTSVRATYGDKPSNAGFMLAPGTLPLAVGMVVPDGPAKALRVGDQLVSIDGVV